MPKPKQPTFRKFCALCLKEAQEIAPFQSTAYFMRIWQQFVKSKTDKIQPFICCLDCFSVISKFCSIFHKWEMVRLRLEHSLEDILNIATIGGRIPKRMAKIRAAASKPPPNQQQKGAPQQSRNLVDQLNNWRQNFRRKSQRKLRQVQPQIVVTRLPDPQPNNTSDSEEMWDMELSLKCEIKQEPEEYFPEDTEETNSILDHLTETTSFLDETETTSFPVHELDFLDNLPDNSVDEKLDIEKLSDSKPQSPQSKKRNNQEKAGSINELEGLRNHKRKKRKRGDGFSYKYFHCTVANCPEKFYTKEQCSIHALYHGNFQCQFCDETFTYAPNLSRHEVQVHAPREPVKGVRGRMNYFRCPTCNFSAHQLRDFVKHHTKAHLNLPPIAIPCPVCQAPVGSPLELRVHTKKHHKIEDLDESSIHRCDKCPAYFTQPYPLCLHKVKVHGNNTCDVCGKVLQDRDSLRSHLRRFHPEKHSIGRPFVCELCGLGLVTEKQLERHKMSCLTAQQTKEWQCAECGKIFGSRKRLISHRGTMHSKRKFFCGDCGKDFKSSIDLCVHRTIHRAPREGEVECGECGRKFKEKVKLDRHVKFTHVDKPFECQYCDNKYAWRHHLRNHVKDKHPDKL